MIKKFFKNILNFFYREHLLHCRNGLVIKVFFNRFTLLKETFDLVDIINEKDYNLGASMAYQEETAQWARHWKNEYNK
jgi:hypothetical protein